MIRKAFSPTALLILLVGISFSVLAMSGCAAVWVTPTPTRLPATATATPQRPTATITPSPTSASPGPTPTMQLARVTLDDSALSYWSDPNDISALLYDGSSIWTAVHGGVIHWDRDGSSRFYTVDDGLASPAVRGLALDGEGRVWIGYSDHDGWSCFDGHDWHHYATRQEAVETHHAAMLAARESDPRLWSCRPDSDWLWLPTLAGQVTAYDGERWRLYTEYNGITRDTWLVDIADDGRVWAIGQGVSTCEEGDVWWEDHSLFADIPGSYAINDLAVDKTGGMWLAYGGDTEEAGGVCCLHWEENRWAGYLYALNPSIPAKVHSVVVDPDGTIWLCGEGGFSYHHPGTPWRALSLPGVDVKSFGRDAQGDLWLGTSRGLWRADADGEQLEGPWRVSAPLLGSQVRALHWDGAGRLWVGTTGGVSFIAPDGDTDLLRTGESYALMTDAAGSVWIADGQGLHRSAPDSLSTDRLLAEAVIALATGPDGQLYLCTQTGWLLRLEDGTAQEIADLAALAGSLPRDLAIDSAGTVWFACIEGLGQLDAEGNFHLNTVQDGLLSEDVRAVAVGPEDVLWIATAKGLVRRRADGRWTRFTTESTEGGLRDMQMWDVQVQPDGVLWMATDKGVSRRTPENADWSYYDLPGARCVLPGADGTLWVGSSGGLYRLRSDALIAIPES